MKGEERRERIVNLLRQSGGAVPGDELAKQFDVSRQIIVKDIALIRALNINIYSTNKGYMIEPEKVHTRTFKVIHAEDEVEKELSTIVDLGGSIKDVFVYHKAYGVITVPMSIRSRKDITDYLAELTTGKSSLLMNVTSGYHYHTVEARDEHTLDLIQEKLGEMGFLAKLQEYEPVDFWNK